MVEQHPTRGILLMLTAMLIFALQDGISRHLAETYNVYMALMVRYWFFAIFVCAVAARAPGGIRRAARSGMPKVQVFRSAVLVLEVIIMVQGFVYLGLVESHAVFACYPLVVTALSGPVLGEKVGWRRLAAIGIGFVGVMIILQPGVGVFSPYALIPLISACLFALYSLLTRYVGRVDPALVSLFYTGTVGAVIITAVGIWHWMPMTPADWGWMGLLCVTAAVGHFLLIKAYEIAEASAIQPFAYLQLVFASTIGIMIFGETLKPNVAIGAAVVVAAGVFTLLRARKKARRA